MVLLQEVVDSSLARIRQSLGADYNFVIADNEYAYYCVILLSRRMHLIEKTLIDFEQTTMQRHLLSARVQFRPTPRAEPIPLTLHTSHLESGREFARLRVRQLQFCFQQMESSSSSVIFGGDLNLRSSDVEQAGGVPNLSVDLHEMLGARRECWFTWDARRNSNIRLPPQAAGGGGQYARARFDRLYYRPLPDNKIVLHPAFFGLVGLQKLRTCGRFPSDHWGIYTIFEIRQ